MAEVVGVVAAGVAFVEVIPKIISGAIKLRGMWEHFKEVPDCIKSLSVQIELYGLALKPMEPDSTSSNLDGGVWAGGVGTRIVVQCREAVEVLSKSVDDVSQELMSAKRMRRAVLKGKLVLKKDFWAKTEQNLLRVASMLSVAMNLRLISSTDRVLDMVIGLSQKNDQYGQVQDPDKAQKQTRSVLKTQSLLRKSNSSVDDKQLSLMNNHVGTSVTGSVGIDWTRSSGGSRWRATPRMNNSLGCDKYYFQFKPPNWITRKAWSMASSISTSGFDVKIRAYSVVSNDSPVMELAKRGDVEGLLDLFDKKLASPFDMTERGFSLLDFALLSGQTQVVAVMLDWGLDLSLFFNPGTESSRLYWLFCLFNDDRPGQIVEAIHEIALANNVYEEYADCWLQSGHVLGMENRNIVWAKYLLLKYLGALKFFLPYLRPGHYRLPVQDRLHFLCVNVSAAAECVRYVLWADGKVQKEDVHALDTIGFSLIKFVLTACGRELHSPTYSSELEALRQLRRDIIQWTASLHLYDEPPVVSYLGHFQEQGTALHAVIRSHACRDGCEDHVAFSQWRQIVERSLQYWLEDLQEVGIDLNEYGKTEWRIFHEIHKIKKIVYPIFESSVYFEHDRHSRSRCLLAAFSYGPEPKDWKFSWDLRCEELVGQFWKLIDNPPLMMPGAWHD